MAQLLVKTIADFATTLVSKVAIGSTTATITSGLDADGIQLPTATYGFTIDRNNSSKEHFTALLTGAALTNIKTVTRGTGIGTAGFVRSHRKGAEIIISDHVSLKRIMDLLDGTNDFDAGTPLKYDGTATINANNMLATKGYVDGVASGSAVLTNQQIVEDGIAGETVSAGNLIYFDETQDEWMKCDADTITTLFNVKLAIALGSGTNGNSISGGILTRGQYTTSGLTKGDLVYASNTAGAFVSGTSGTIPRVIGVAKDSTHLNFDPDFQNRLYDYAVDAVGTDSYAITLPGALSVPFVGMQIKIKVGTANTGASSLAVNGGSAIAIKKFVSADTETGDFLANQIIVLVFDGTNYQVVSQNIGKSPVVLTYLNAASPATWTKQPGLKYAIVQIWAGGGGGATGTATNGPMGGGGGAYNTITLLASAIGTTETVTVGAGGAAVTGSNVSGNNGGNSSFGSLITVYGGGGGSNATQLGTGGGIKSVGTSGGIGGAPVGGLFGVAPNLNASVYGGGGAGTNGATLGGASVYGGGGAGFSSGGGGGSGGDSYYGGGGGGGGNTGALQPGGTSIVGGSGGSGGDGTFIATAGAVPGGGGGGSRSNSVASGAGGAGKVIITEFY